MADQMPTALKYGSLLATRCYKMLEKWTSVPGPVSCSSDYHSDAFYTDWAVLLSLSHFLCSQQTTQSQYAPHAPLPYLPPTPRLFEEIGGVYGLFVNS